jgi:hypothetical protein
MRPIIRPRVFLKNGIQAVRDRRNESSDGSIVVDVFGSEPRKEREREPTNHTVSLLVQSIKRVIPAPAEKHLFEETGFYSLHSKAFGKTT